jgi:RNA polymerase sigma-70 factor (ECF subfamily)
MLMSQGLLAFMREDLTSPQAFEALVIEHQRAVFRTLARLTGAGPHVEDLAQEAFLRLYRALPEFRGDAALTTYLYRILINLAQDEWKRRRRERTHLSPEPAHLAQENDGEPWLENFAGDELAGEHARSPEQLLSERELQAAVDTALLRLPDDERAVLVLYHGEERSYQAIAETLRMPINTVRTHLHRGRKHIGKLVREQLGTRADLPMKQRSGGSPGRLAGPADEPELYRQGSPATRAATAEGR